METAGLKFDEDPSIRTALEKLQEYVGNCEEDKRTLRHLMEEQERLQDLSQLYYQEKESVIIERNQIQEKLENSNAGKAEKRLKALEEERSLMRSDFNIQINSLVEENDRLKTMLSRYEPVVEAPSDASFAQKPTNPDTSQHEKDARGLMDSSKTSEIPQAQQRSGIFNSIASFFLTDSEIDTPR